MFIQKIGKLTILSLSLLILLTACNFAAEPSSQTVTLMGTLTGKGIQEVQQVLAPFTEATGIKVKYEGTDAFATVLPVRVDAGNPPDLALFPQPGLMADFARDGELIPIEEILSPSQLSEAFSQNWLNLAQADNTVYGIWYRIYLKSLVWYSPVAFTEKGYQIPKTWDEMIALSDQIVADGGVPWCMGFASGDATGWAGTDWIEDIMLRTVEPEVYDQWVNHDIPFNHPAVKNAFQRFGAIALNPNYVVGGKTGILSIFFGDAPKPLFDQPPGCYLHHQATFISSFFPEDVILGEDVDIFPFPSIEPDLGTPLLVGGQIIGMFNDTPETRQLMEYLVSVEPHEILAGIKGSISPHKQVSLEVYPDPVTKRQAKLLLSDEQVIRYDASDQLPGAVGTGTFWTGIIDYVSGQDLDRILQDIETSWTSN